MIRLESNVCDWCDEAESLFEEIYADDSTGGLAGLRNQVKNHKASLHHVTDGKITIGYFAVRIDQLATLDEMVIIAAAGRAKGIPLFDVFIPLLTEKAKEAGCESMRIDTTRKGVFKKCIEHGFYFGQWMMRKKLT